MKSIIRNLLACHAVVLCSTIACVAEDGSPRQPVPVIFDTDMYSDIDDALALAMLHALQDRGEVKLLAVTLSTNAKWIPAYVDLVNTYYGHRDIPIGMVQGGISAQRFPSPAPYSPNGVNYTQHLAQLKSASGEPVYLHRLQAGDDVEDSVVLLRRMLVSQADHSVVMIQVGYCTNLARLLASKPDAVSPLDGISLVRTKVRLLSVMAGSFASFEAAGKKHIAGAPETNLLVDVPAAQELFARWPTPVVASGYEIGFRMRFPQSAIDRYFNYTKHHPIAETYNYVAPFYPRSPGQPNAAHDHATYDLTAVLFAARPDDGYFSLSGPGQITVLPDGGSSFEARANGNQRYLTLSEDQRERTLEAMIALASQPPAANR